MTWRQGKAPRQSAHTTKEEKGGESKDSKSRDCAREKKRERFVVALMTCPREGVVADIARAAPARSSHMGRGF